MKPILTLLAALFIPVNMPWAAEEMPDSSPRAATAESPTSPSRTDSAAELSPKSTSPAIAQLQAQWDSIKDREGEELLTMLAQLDLLDVKLQIVYQLYLDDQRSVAQLETSGLGENHPEIRALRTGIEVQRHQLMEGAKQLKENVQQKLAIERRAASLIPSIFHLTADQASRFQWGQPSSGLRLALARPEAVGEKDSGQLFDFRMIIQNVSDQAVRFNLAQSAEQSPRLKLRINGRTMMEVTGERWTSKEILLESRTAVSLRPFPNRLADAFMRVDDPDLAFSVELDLLPAPGTWSGRLASADTVGLFTAR